MIKRESRPSDPPSADAAREGQRRPSDEGRDGVGRPARGLSMTALRTTMTVYDNARKQRSGVAGAVGQAAAVAGTARRSSLNDISAEDLRKAGAMPNMTVATTGTERRQQPSTVDAESLAQLFPPGANKYR